METDMQAHESQVPVAAASRRRLRRRFEAEVAALGLARSGVTSVVGPNDLVSLPESAVRFLRFMNVPGRPRDWSFRAGWEGRFRLRPDAAWLPCEAWQYNSSVDVARVFHMQLTMAWVLPTMVRDTYVRGRARMLGRIFDRFAIVDAEGPELDMSELATYLNDAILFAPSMLLGPSAAWSAVDADTFRIALRHDDLMVTADVTIDDRGAPQLFTTDDRYVSDPFTKGHPLIRGRWTTPIDAWATDGERPVMIRGRAVWHLPGGTFEYADLRPIRAAIAYDVAPGG
jgi:hypothetical protein